MRGFRPISLATALVLVSIFVPIGGAALISWNLALRSYQDRLTRFSERMIRRTENTFREAKAALEAMASSAAIPCSEEHIAQMQFLVAENRAVVGMGYRGDDGLLKCSNYGPSKTAIPRPATPPLVMADGIHMIPRLVTRITRNGPRILLFDGNREILVDPRSLTDIAIDEEIQLAVSLDPAGVIAERNAPDPELIRSLHGNPGTGSQGGHVYSIIDSGGWAAISIGSIHVASAEYRELNKVMLPIGALISFLLIILGLQIIRKRNSLEGRLAAAVRRRDFTVHYQPIIDIRSGACIGAEALVRWPQPGGGYIGPDVFIPLAEKSGLIFAITDQVIAAVTRDMADTLHADENIHVSINICAADVSSGRVLDVLRRELNEAGIPSKQIWLEATERGFMDIKSARNSILLAHMAGHLVAIDDFGTGYSSLNYLESLPVEMIKIDKSFVDTVGKVTSKSSVLPHIIGMAKTLNLRCVAEGVETDTQREYLIGQGIEFAQGWLFSKPLPADQFITFLGARTPSLA